MDVRHKGCEDTVQKSVNRQHGSRNSSPERTMEWLIPMAAAGGVALTVPQLMSDAVKASARTTMSLMYSTLTCAGDTAYQGVGWALQWEQPAQPPTDSQRLENIERQLFILQEMITMQSDAEAGSLGRSVVRVHPVESGGILLIRENSNDD
jgi:hypothetical protein